MDENRRSLTLIALNTLAVAGLAPSLIARGSETEWSAPAVAGAPSRAERIARQLPNVRFTNQHGRPVKFYDDIVKGKKVLINFMYTECSETCPRTTANLLRVHRAFGDRVGRDVFFVSITLTPERDTPEVLKAYAERNGCGEGWSFLTGTLDDTDRLRKHLGVYDDNPDIREHVGILTFGNEPEGKWGATAALAAPDLIMWSVTNRIDPWVARPWPARASREEK